MEEHHSRALRQLYLGLEGSNVHWVVTASLNLALRGLPVQVRDIDVLTDKPGAYEIERCFARYVVRPVSLRTSERIRSYFGVLLLEGVDVEVMAELEVLDEVEGWQPTPPLASHREVIVWRGMPIPVRSLDAEHIAYQQLGRTERAELVRRWLQAQ
jgi:hypothetical protein